MTENLEITQNVEYVALIDVGTLTDNEKKITIPFIKLKIPPYHPNLTSCAFVQNAIACFHKKPFIFIMI